MTMSTAGYGRPSDSSRIPHHGLPTVSPRKLPFMWVAAPTGRDARSVSVPGDRNRIQGQNLPVELESRFALQHHRTEIDWQHKAFFEGLAASRILQPTPRLHNRRRCLNTILQPLSGLGRHLGSAVGAHSRESTRPVRRTTLSTRQLSIEGD